MREGRFLRMWAYHNEREQAVWLHPPPPYSASLGEWVRVGPGEDLVLDAPGDAWLSVVDGDGLMLKSGYVRELCAPDVG
jgi:hypothetical protein